MHKLDRDTIIAPTCLVGYDYRTQTWADLKSSCKKQVRFALYQIQGILGISSEDAGEYGLRCAYCEGVIWHEGHIEHFRRKNPKHPNGYPELTFEWSNLFLACGSHQHCGHYKDLKNADIYDPDQLIKPDEHDPEYYLYFHSSGEVRVRHGLSSENKERATETIRVFALDNTVLAGERAKAVKSYRARNKEELDELASWEETDRRAYLMEEIEATRWHPYATTIKHFLQHT